MRPSAFCRLLHQAAATAKPRHLLGIRDLAPAEFATLVRNAAAHKNAFKHGRPSESVTASLLGKTVAMIFDKRSTRTRVSTEAAVNKMGGHPMFLGKDDIQLGVNESLLDTSVVISSMTSCIVGRIQKHADIVSLSEASSVPVLNALSDGHHPLQTIADFQAILEAHPHSPPSGQRARDDLGLGGMKVAWVGDANNVLFDLASACVKMGVDIAVACPKDYGIPDRARAVIDACAAGVSRPGALHETAVPEEAVRAADVIVTDTWVSMGWEQEAQARLKAFEAFRVTEELATRAGAKEDWKFLHCLPRHPEEVSDDVFYGPRSLVFPEAENRLWSAIAALEAFVVNKGDIQPTRH